MVIAGSGALSILLGGRGVDAVDATGAATSGVFTTTASGGARIETDSCGFRAGSSDFSAFACTSGGAPAPCPSPPSCVPPMSAIKASDFFDADASPSGLAAPSKLGFTVLSSDSFLASEAAPPSGGAPAPASLAVRPRLASVEGLLLSEARLAVNGLPALGGSLGLGEAALVACADPRTRRGLVCPEGPPVGAVEVPLLADGAAGFAGLFATVAVAGVAAAAEAGAGGAAAFFGDRPGPGDRAFRMESLSLDLRGCLAKFRQREGEGKAL
mmetsp:Transcript_66618/g.117787  ORF Transcript_66618/g.117787 Transcript_66618/m.117787 type:complete len:270 (-) Transcript_66618:17-826(-)